MAVIMVPNAGSTLSAAGSIANSASTWAWIGLQTLTASGSVCWYQTTAGSTSGSELMSISLPAQQQVVYGPFAVPCGLYAAGVSGGCALVYLRTGRPN